MKVLHLNEHIEIRGGVETYLKLLKESSEGGSFFWLGINETESKKFKVQRKGSKDQIISSSEIRSYFLDLVKKRQIDIICIHSISNPFLIKQLNGIKPIVRFMHEPRMFCPGQGKFWRFEEKPCVQPFGLHCCVKAYTKGCNNRHPKRILSSWRNTAFEIEEGNKIYEAIVVMSDYMKEEAIKVGFDSSKIHINPYFTKSIESQEIDVEQKFTNQKIIFSGRLIEHKGPHTFLDIVFPILKKHKHVKIEIIGDGPMLAKLRQAVVNAGLDEQIDFLGWLKAHTIKQKLLESTVFCFTSLYPEAFGIVGIEAMMAGTPVVGFDVGGSSTWLENQSSGYLIEPEDCAGFGRKIELLLTNKLVYDNLSSSSHEKAKNLFSKEVHLKKLNNLFQSVI